MILMIDNYDSMVGSIKSLTYKKLLSNVTLLIVIPV